MKLSFAEKALFHQIHPTKLITDIVSAIVSLYLFWKRDLVLGLIVTIVPPLFVSGILIMFTDLRRYKKSRLGKYIRKYMSPVAQALRLFGFIVMAVGAWYQKQWVILAGLCIILPAWSYGLVLYHKWKLRHE